MPLRRLGVRGKIFAASIVLITLVVVSGGAYLQHQLRIDLEQRVQSELSRSARSASQLFDAEGPLEYEKFARQFGDATGLRITFIDAKGTVIADSSVDASRISTLEPHGDRPEFIAAQRDGMGTSRRRSATTEQELLYVAVPHKNGYIIRVARPLSEVDEALGHLRWLMVIAGLIGIITAVVLGWIASHFVSTTLRSLVSSARRITSGDEPGPLDIQSENELEGLAGSFNQMAEEVERTVGELARERALVKAVLKGMSESVFALDAERRVKLMNPSAVELLELDSVPYQRSLLEVLDVPALAELLGEGPDVVKGSAEFELPNGKFVMATLRPQKGVEGSVLVMHDVTDIRRLETIRRDFVANVSHELRTPVTIIRANAETLLDGALSDEKFANTLLSALHRNSERLSNIITDLLDLSRIEAGLHRSNLEHIDVNAIAEHAAAGISSAAEKKEIEISVNVAPEITVLGDSKSLEQVIFNLLDNAVKYTPNGGAVQIGSIPEDDTIRVTISDNGPGVPEEYRHRVFERFYRLDPGRSRDMGGTGLGLAIVKHLVEAMGGEVGVDGKEGGGSTFWVRLPRAEAQLGGKSAQVA